MRDISEGGRSVQQAFVHYNGWGARWDEWIPSSSARLAPFRTFTVQNPKSIYMSPYPNIQPDPALQQPLPAPFQGDEARDTTTKMMEEILSLLNDTAVMLKDFKETRENLS